MTISRRLLNACKQPKVSSVIEGKHTKRAPQGKTGVYPVRPARRRSSGNRNAGLHTEAQSGSEHFCHHVPRTVFTTMLTVFLACTFPARAQYLPLRNVKRPVAALYCPGYQGPATASAEVAARSESRSVSQKAARAWSTSKEEGRVAVPTLAP